MMRRAAILAGLLVMGGGGIVTHAGPPAATKSEALPATLFDGKTATLTATGRAALDAIAASVKAGGELTITAAFDRPDARGLADARAAAMALYLKKKKVKTTRRPTQAFGSQRKTDFGFVSFGTYLALRK